MTPGEPSSDRDRDLSESDPPDEETVDRLSERIRRSQKGRDEQARPLWFGLGMFGLVGWSITVPTILGLLLGIWLDGVLGSSGSWTLICLLAGMALGCFNAWHWIHQSAYGSSPGDEDSELKDPDNPGESDLDPGDRS